MGLYNFKPRFAPKIRSGAKRHTIRAKRLHPDKPGNTLHLYVGLRTKKAKLIARVLCVKVEDIEIRQGMAIFDRRERCLLNSVFIAGQRLSIDECEALAQADGFSSFAEMMKFWDGRLPFKGDIIHWRAAA